MSVAPQQYDDDLEWYEAQYPVYPQVIENAQIGASCSLEGLRGFDPARPSTTLAEIREREGLVPVREIQARPKRKEWRQAKKPNRLEKLKSMGINVPQMYRDLYWDHQGEKYDHVIERWRGGHNATYAPRLNRQEQAKIEMYKKYRKEAAKTKIEEIKASPGRVELYARVPNTIVAKYVKVAPGVVTRAEKPLAGDVLKILAKRVEKSIGKITDETKVEKVEAALAKRGLAPKIKAFRTYAGDLIKYCLYRNDTAEERLARIQDNDTLGAKGASRDKRGLQRLREMWGKVNFTDTEHDSYADPTRVIWSSLTTNRDMDKSNYPALVNEVYKHLESHLAGRITGISRFETIKGVRHIHTKLIVDEDCTAGLPITDGDIKEWDDIINAKWDELVSQQRTSLGQRVYAVRVAQDLKLLRGTMSDVMRVIKYQSKSEQEDTKRKARTKYLDKIMSMEQSVTYIDKPSYNPIALIDALALKERSSFSEDELEAISDYLPYTGTSDRDLANKYFVQIGRVDLVNTNDIAGQASTRPPFQKQWVVINPDIFESYCCLEEIHIDRETGRFFRSELFKACNKKLKAMASPIRMALRPFQCKVTILMLSNEEVQECLWQARISRKIAEANIRKHRQKLKQCAVVQDIHPDIGLQMASGFP